jgi:hypothetical protein
LNSLLLLRNGIRTEINDDEKKLADLLQSRDPNNVTVAKQFQRELGWKYEELGYAALNQDVANVTRYSFSSRASLVSELKMLTDAQFLLRCEVPIESDVAARARVSPPAS